MHEPLKKNIDIYGKNGVIQTKQFRINMNDCQTMRIGIDFDNTLAHYDNIFTRLAQEWRIIEPEEALSKQDIRLITRKLENGELIWQRLQGQVYGQFMHEAEQFPGEDLFLRRCASTPNVQIFIVSHKTEFGHFDESRTRLREAARLWMQQKGFFDPKIYAISSEHLFFESSQQDKVDRIANLHCDFFIDDLIELFANPLFPASTKKILFSHALPSESTNRADYTCHSWTEIEAVIFGN